MVKKMRVMLSLFGASGYRYKFSLYTFGKVWGVEGALPACGGVFLFLRRSFDRRRGLFSYKMLYCGVVDDLSKLSVGALARETDDLRKANCVAILPVDDAAERERVASDIILRELKINKF